MNSSTSNSTKNNAAVSTRLARTTDAGAVIDLLKQSHLAARWEFPFDPIRAHAIFGDHLQSPFRCVLVMEYRGEVAGVLMAYFYDHPFGAGLVSNETVFFIAPSARGRGFRLLLRAYENWAREQGCIHACMATLALNDVSKIYRREGYAPVETHHMKRLIPGDAP